MPESVGIKVVMREIFGICYDIFTACCRKVSLLQFWYGMLPEYAVIIISVHKEAKKCCYKSCGIARLRSVVIKVVVEDFAGRSDTASRWEMMLL